MEKKLSITPPKKRGVFGRVFDSAYDVGVKNLRRIGEAAKSPNRIGLAAVKGAAKGFREGDIADAIDSGLSSGIDKAVDSVAKVYDPSMGSTPTVTPPKVGRSKGDTIREQNMKNAPSVPVKQPAPEKPGMAAVGLASASRGIPRSSVPKATASVSPAPVGDDEVLSNEDMSKKGYTLIGMKSGQKKWRKGAETDAENKHAAELTAANIVKNPVFRGRAGAPKPLETEMKMVNNKPTIVQTGGDSTPEFERLKAAQARNAAGTGTKEDDDMVAASVSSDPLGRQPGQIARLRADERAGKYQAGRRVR